MGGPVMSHITTQTTWCTVPIPFAWGLEHCHRPGSFSSSPSWLWTNWAAPRYKRPACTCTGPSEDFAGWGAEHLAAHHKTLFHVLDNRKHNTLTSVTQLSRGGCISQGL